MLRIVIPEKYLPRGAAFRCYAAFIVALWLCFALASAAGTAKAETINLFGTEVDVQSAHVTLKKTHIGDYKRLEEYLSQLPNLQTFDMYGIYIPRDEMAALSERFPNVRFGWTICFSKYRIRTDATAFSTLNDGSPPYFSSRSFDSWLPYCKDLLALDLGHNTISDISFLYHLPKLRILILACNKITDLTPIASLKDLEYLELFMNNITDVTPLSGLDKLIDLNLCVNDISDPTPLYGLKGLQRLWISRNNLTQEQEQALAEALPDTEMNFTTVYSTQGGWRTHDRYFTIRKIFKYGAYREWE